MFYTYIHYQKDTGIPFYIGKGSGNRYKHCTNRNKYWNNVVKKHGFVSEILSIWKTEEEAFDHEKLLISCFKDMKYKLVNMTEGGEGGNGLKAEKHPLFGKPRKEETKIKISNANKGKISPNKGKPLLEKIKIKMSLARMGVSPSNKGKKMTDEQKKKISKSLLGNVSPNKGKKMSQEQKNKISISLKGNKNSLNVVRTEQTKQKISNAIKKLRAVKI